MLAKQAGVSLQPVSEALTHSDKQVTKVYVITADSLIKQLVKILECPQRLMSPLTLSLN
ncbi:integrase [Streptococcus sinensis]